jgi:hypothetical protein
VLSWTKIYRLPSTKSEKNGKSTTSRLTSPLLKNHLAPATSTIADKHEHQRHTKKLISPDLKNDEGGGAPV